jgi:fumarylpyruvate hydrolase
VEQRNRPDCDEGESVSEFLFPPPSPAAAPIRGRAERFPIRRIFLLIHGVPAVIAHLSQYYHLQPGDLIYTGTPEGVGPVKPGDRLEGSIEGVGTIAVTVSAAA